MFSDTDSVGTRLSAWKTNPTRSRRNTESFLRLSRVTSVPPIRTLPAVGLSSPAAHCSSVDFPHPDNPMTAVRVPRAKLAVTS